MPSFFPLLFNQLDVGFMNTALSDEPEWWGWMFFSGPNPTLSLIPPELAYFMAITNSLPKVCGAAILLSSGEAGAAPCIVLGHRAPTDTGILVRQMEKGWRGCNGVEQARVGCEGGRKKSAWHGRLVPDATPSDSSWNVSFLSLCQLRRRRPIAS